MNGNLPPPMSNFGLYRKIIVHRRSGVHRRKYANAAGAIKGDAGASANKQSITTPESTYILYGIGGPAPKRFGEVRTDSDCQYMNKKREPTTYLRLEQLVGSMLTPAK